MKTKQPTHNVQELSRQVWLAGLGAFARARQEGGQLFETLVQEGQATDRRAKQAGGGETRDMKGETETVADQVEEIRGRASGVWNKLEEVFQMRVTRALCRLGAPTRDDIQQLLRQVDLLSRNIQDLTRAAEAKARKTDATPTASEPAAGVRVADPVV